MTVTLWDHPLSPYAQKVKIALREKGVPFDTIVHEAQVREASLVMIGRGDNPRWKSRIMGETVLRVLELSHDLATSGERPTIRTRSVCMCRLVNYATA